MKPDGSVERLIANGYLVDSPEWSPPGRYVLYTLEEHGCNNTDIVVVDPNGEFGRTNETRRNTADATWSPYFTLYACHMMGCSSTGGVHSHQHHMFKLIEVTQSASIPVRCACLCGWP